MAGGRGTRLRPYTTNLPKPLMPLDGVPVIEILIRQLACHGVNRATVVACYLAPLLRQFLCLRQFPEMEITVFEEPAPLGTAGCLGLIERPRAPFLVVNGDLLTTLDFRQLGEFHRGHSAPATVAALRREIPFDVGLVEMDSEGRMQAYVEKPKREVVFGMGVCCFDPEVCEHVTAGEAVAMPELLRRIREAGETVMCHCESCYWQDIGRPEDLRRASERFRRDRSLFLSLDRMVA